MSKEVVGFNISRHHNSDLVMKTIREAMEKTGQFPGIFHCDRGAENLAQVITGHLESHGTQISVCDPGSPWQNEWSESFFRVLRMNLGTCTGLKRLENW